MPHQPAKYWFALGREHLLSAAEIRAVLNTDNFHLSGSLLKVAASLEPAALIKQLGGTIKIAKEKKSGVNEKELLFAMAAEARKLPGKIEFGVSMYGEGDLTRQVKTLGLTLKKMLKDEKRPARLVFKGEPQLSSVTVEMNNLVVKGREFIVEKTPPLARQRGSLFSLAITCAVQPFREFSRRDYGRPGRDDLSGMLPPKLSMIMINLAQAPRAGTLLDPFCGSGTILSEAMLLGYENITGSDISPIAVRDAEQNVRWTAEIFNIKYPIPNIQIFQSAVEKLSSKIQNETTDATVTEPYLGKPLRGQETKAELLKQASDLKKLYLGAFKQFQNILKQGGTIVFLIPRFKYKNKWLTIDCREEIEKLGFKVNPLLPGRDYLLYARPDQRVGREVWRFKKFV